MTSDTPASILVVDDDIDTCQNLSDILTDIGYDVAVAHNGLDALGLVRRQPFDIALLDLKMPGMDGLTLYREIKKLRAGTVAIVISAFASLENETAAYGAGCLRVLAKPVNFNQLLPLLGTALLQPTILVVDDDQDLCANLWDVLRHHGYRVCLAYDEEQAKTRLLERRFDLVLIDMKLPRGDGSSVLLNVRAANPEARVVLITGFRGEMEAVIQRALTDGADTVLYKPFDMPLLLSTVQQLAK
ncbi:MAG: response regulator [Planctomycetales bacterium]|nr:response regulator [Planctomycetales bacterium]